MSGSVDTIIASSLVIPQEKVKDEKKFFPQPFRDDMRLPLDDDEVYLRIRYFDD